MREKQLKKFENLVEKQRPSPESTFNNTDRVVINLSQVNLSDSATSILSKGLNFAIAPRSIPKEEIITGVENALRKLRKSEADEIREEVSHIIRKARPPKPNLTRAEREAVCELRKIDDSLILPADKGNATVIISKEDYRKKVCGLLDDPTYKELNSDPTAKIQRNIKDLMKHSSIPQEERRSLIQSAPKPPRLYGLPKIHKDGIPLRPIVSAIDSPTHKLAKYLAHSLRHSRA
ncbi:uncharacterized protein LOC124173954 [Ischnura elegans]|uniref:uncharacterized protein LOC124173954 n=1 Tax=Ischnura elegans TaxID=197161 RepID=UPI001ED87B17|nr:uncharacterized protein LOC124173954 [Ischnura elegans]